MNNFGKYFHHIPARKQEKIEREKSRLADPEKAREDYLAKLQVLLSITYDHLGEETVINSSTCSFRLFS